MSNTTKLFALFLALTLFSCQQDSDSISDSIVGKWNITANYADDLKVETTGLGSSYVFEYTVEGHDFDAQIELRDDGTFSSSGSYKQTVMTTFDGEELSQTYSYNNVFGNGTYEYDGTTLTMTDGTQTISVEVIDVSGSKMKWKWLYTDVQSSGGATSTTSATYFYEFEK